jgi:hypothetical protein
VIDESALGSGEMGNLAIAAANVFGIAVGVLVLDRGGRGRCDDFFGLKKA